MRSTLDTLAEGVLIVDTNQQIVLANKAFADKCGRTRDKLQGLQMAELQWTRSDQKGGVPLATGDQREPPQIGALLTMQSMPHRKGTFVVNATPVLGSDGSPRGAMVTFDDVTSIEEKNQQLEEMLQSLKTSFEDVRQKNSELKLLAARDPLTGCLNRRSLFDAFVGEWQSAAAQGSFLSCIMVDVDHFKNVNDEHGHAAGDEVLQKLSAALLEGVRQSDFVGRYGGEEFCLLLPRTSLRAAAAIAEKLRLRVAEACIEPQGHGQFWRIVDRKRRQPSARTAGRVRPRDVSLEEAGRNRVTTWSAATTDQDRRPQRRSPLRVRARRRCTRAFRFRRSTL